MKRSAKNRSKLALQHETLRTLGSVELARVLGGVPMQGDESRGGSCVAKDIAPDLDVSARATVAPT